MIGLAISGFLGWSMYAASRETGSGVPVSIGLGLLVAVGSMAVIQAM